MILRRHTMAKRRKTPNPDSKKMAALLNIGKAKRKAKIQDSPQVNLEETLIFHLSKPMPLHGTVSRFAAAIPELVTNALYVCDSACIGELLRDNATSTGQLEDIKALYRRSSVRAASREEKTVAVAIYYGAIAKALVAHGHKISAFSYDRLGRAFAMLVEKQWIPDYLKQLYSQAAIVCREQLDVQTDAEQLA
jgi:hypothetical protein